MTRFRVAHIILMLALATTLACGSRATPEQRVQKLRLDHEITPVGTNVIHNAEGKPTLVVDLRVVNKGADHLDNLTVRVTVRAPDGTEKLSRRVTLDLSGARPGVGVQLAATIPDVDVDPDDEVMVELESQVPPEVLRTFPEYREVVGGAAG